MSVLVRVQHHPARADLVAPLLARLPAGTEVATDPNPDSAVRSPLRTYLEALRRPLPDEGVTDLAVVQDDAWPADDFEARLAKVVAEKPDDMVALFVPGSGAHRVAMLRAAARKQPYQRLATTWIPTVALLWPVFRAREFLSFAEEKWDVEKTRGDDAPVGYWCARRRVHPIAAVPSLVEHPDVVPSLIGRRNSAGRNRARVAAIL